MHFPFPAFRSARLFALLALPLLTLPVAAQNLYVWDINGAAPESGGSAPSGIWATDVANWTYDGTYGTLGTFGWTDGKFARFAAGSDSIGSYTVTVAAGGVAAGGIYLQRGTLTLTGGVITITANPFTGSNMMNYGSSLTINNVLAGTERLNVNGSGNVTFNGTNTYSGGTTVNQGKLFVSSAANLGTGAVDVAAFSTLTGTAALQFDHAVTVYGTNALLAGQANLGFGTTATGSLTLTTGGRVTTATGVTFGVNAGSTGTGSLTDAGTRLVTGTTLTLGDSGAGSLTVADGATVVAPTLRFGNTASGAGTLQLNAGGILEVGGTNGIVRGAGSAAFNLAGGTVKVTGSALTTSVPATLTNTSTVDTNGFAATLSGVLSGSGALSKAGTGTLTLSGTNTYAGGTTVTAGTLAFDSLANLGSGSLTVTGGTLSTSAILTLDRAVSVGGTGATFNAGALYFGAGNLFTLTAGGSVTVGDTIGIATNVGATGTASVTGADARLTVGNKVLLGYSGTGSLTIADGGTVATATLIFAENGGNSTLNLNTGGTLEVGGTQGVRQGPGTNQFNFAGGTVKVTGAALTTTVPATLTNTSTIDTNGFAATFSGVLSGSGALTKAGAGTLTLSGTNTYAGATTVSAGTLAVSAAANLGTGTVDVTGGTLTSSGALILNRAASVTGSSALLSIPTSYLEVGRDSAGSLTVSSGGKVTTSQSAAFGIFGGGPGTGTITGAGSSLTVGSTLFLGYYGSGTLTVADSGAVTTPNLLLGHEVGGTGTLQLNSGGTLTTSGFVEVGKYSTGLLELASGGTLHAGASVAFGLGAGSSGTGTLTGNGTRLASDSIVFLGYGGAGSLTLADGATLAAPLLNFGSQAGGAGTLHLNAGGTLEVGGTNGIARGAGSAAFNFSGGTVKVTGANLTTTVPMTLANASTVNTNGFDATLGGVLSGTGSLNKTGSGTLSLTGANTFSGGTTVSSGTLQVAATGNLGAGGALVTSGTTLETLGSAGSGAITVNSGGTFKAHASTGSGLTTVNSGALLDAKGSGGIGAVALAGGTFRLFDSNLASGSVTLAGGVDSRIDTNGLNATLAIAGTDGGLIKQGLGTLQISGATGYTSAITLQSGLVSAAAGADLGAATLNFAGGTLGISGAAPTNLDGHTINAPDAIRLHVDQGVLTINQALSATTNLVKSGAGTLVLASGDNAYGTTTINGGTLRVGHADALGGPASTVGVYNSALDLGGIHLTVGTLNGDGAIINNTSGTQATFTLGHGNTTNTYSGSIWDRTTGTGTVALWKIGTGSLTLAGTGTYTGGTTVENGTLRLASSTSAGTSAIVVQSGAVLQTDFAHSSGPVLPTVSLAGGTFRLGGSLSDGTVQLAANQASTLDTGNFGASLHLNAADGSTLVKTGTGSLNFLSTTTGNDVSVRIAGGNLTLLAQTQLQNGTIIVDGGNVTVNDFFLGQQRMQVLSGSVNADSFLVLAQRGISLNGAASSINSGHILMIQMNSDPTPMVVSGGATVHGTNGIQVGGSGLNPLTLLVQGGSHMSGSTVSVSADNTLLQVETGSTMTTPSFIAGKGSTLVDATSRLAGKKIRIGDGTLTLNGTAELGDVDAITRTGTGTFNLGGEIKVTGANLTGSAPIVLTGTTARINTNAFDASLSGALSGTGALTKTGAGTLLLNAANTYTGNTTISAGTLLLGATGAIDSSPILTVAAGATFDASAAGLFARGSGQTLTGSGLIEGVVTMNAGSHLAPGSSPGTLTFADGLTLNGGTILDFELGTASDLIRVSGGTLAGPASGTVTINLANSGGFAANTYVLFNFAGATLSDFSAVDFVLGTDIDGFDYAFNLTGASLELIATASAIPEPSTYASLAGALALGLVCLARRRGQLRVSP